MGWSRLQLWGVLSVIIEDGRKRFRTHLCGRRENRRGGVGRGWSSVQLTAVLGAVEEGGVGDQDLLVAHGAA